MPVNIIIALISGVLSFLSPCVLALAPGYIIMLTAMTGIGNDADKANRTNSIIGALLYSAGFSIVFITFGAATSWLGQLFRFNRQIFSLITGFAVVIMGLHASGLLSLRILSRSSSPLQGIRKHGYSGCFLTGIAFAFGWSPCVGPILGTIMTIAGNQDTMLKGVYLLIAYSAGLSLPFVILALGLEKVKPAVRRLLRYSSAIEKATGLFMVAIGLLLILDGFHPVSAFMLRISGSWTPDALIEPLLRQPD